MVSKKSVYFTYLAMEWDAFLDKFMNYNGWTHRQKQT